MFTNRLQLNKMLMLILILNIKRLVEIFLDICLFSVHTWSRRILTHLACLDSEDAPEDNLRAGCHHPASDALGVGDAPQAEGEHAGPPRAGPAHCQARGPRLQGTRGHRAVAPTVEDDISGRVNLSGAPGSAIQRILSDNEEVTSSPFIITLNHLVHS